MAYYSDIKFEGNRLRLEGSFISLDGQVTITSNKLQIDDQSRRTNQDGFRRALMHGTQDKLIINYNKDYPGGVTIRGFVLIQDQLVATDLEAQGTVIVRGPDLQLDNKLSRTNWEGLRRALKHDTNDKLVINFNKDYPGGVTILGEVNVPNQLIVKDIDLYNEVITLKRTVQALEARISALEVEIPPGHRRNLERTGRG